MKTYLECIPCFLRQSLDAAKLAKASLETRKKVMDEVSRILPEFSLDVTPPEIAREVYGIVERITGNSDFYEQLKKKSNKTALKIYPELKRIIAGSKEPLLAAVRLAVAGNVIDYGVPQEFDIKDEIKICLKKDFVIFDFQKFEKVLKKAENILYLHDNAGEIVFDKLLIETIGKKIVSVVREKPIINDVTMEDAREVSLMDVSEVISSGSDVPGTPLSRCNNEFKKRFWNADLIISKGQGNYETLADVKKRPIVFIFKAKCPVIAGHVGCRLGDIILKMRGR